MIAGIRRREFQALCACSWTSRFNAVVAEGFFIHKRHEHIIPAGASVDEVIDVDIILFVLLIVVVRVANRLRCNGFVLNINSPTSSLVGKVGKDRKSVV